MSASDFLRRVQVWILLVVGCAVPLLLITWPTLEPAGRAGEVCGIVVWIVMLVVWDERRRVHGGAQVSNALRTGAIVFLLVQGVAAAILEPLEFAVLYAPTLLSSGMLRFFPSDAGAFYPDFAMPLILTLLSGAQVAGCSWALGRLVEALRPRLAQAGARMRR